MNSDQLMIMEVKHQVYGTKAKETTEPIARMN